MGLDLSLRDRTDGKVTIDAYMRALWRAVRPQRATPTPGMVADRLYHRGLENTLGEIVRRRGVCEGVLRAIREGARAGGLREAVRARRAGGAQARRGHAVAGRGAAAGRRGWRARGVLVPFGSPLYKAGVAQDDQLVSLDGTDAGAGRRRSTKSLAGTSRATPFPSASCAAAARRWRVPSRSTRIRASRSSDREHRRDVVAGAEAVPGLLAERAVGRVPIMVPCVVSSILLVARLRRRVALRAGDAQRAAHLDRRAEGADGAERRARARRARRPTIRRAVTSPAPST